MGTIRSFDLDEIQANCDTKIFVETGTLRGDGVDYALQYDFDKIYSIEIDDELYDQARIKYQHNDNVEILKGSSSEVLPGLITTINSSILFWLDAHFPGADSGKTTYRDCCEELEYNINLPLQAELEAITTRQNTYKDVIIIDDLWLWEDGIYKQDYAFQSTNCNDHMKRNGIDVTREFVVGDKRLEPMIQPFDNTHYQKRVYKHQGYLILIPNK
jgi:hypothetical protein